MPMSAPLSRELAKMAAPRGLLRLDRNADGPLTAYYRIAGVVQDLSAWDANSPLLHLANEPGDTDSLVSLPGTIASNLITIPWVIADLAGLNCAGVWSLTANDGVGNRVLAKGNEIGDLEISEGVA